MSNRCYCRSVQPNWFLLGWRSGCLQFRMQFLVTLRILMAFTNSCFVLSSSSLQYRLSLICVPPQFATSPLPSSSIFTYSLCVLAFGLCILYTVSIFIAFLSTFCTSCHLQFVTLKLYVNTGKFNSQLAVIIIIFLFLYLLSQAFSPRYSPWTNGDPYRSGFNVHTAVLSELYDVPSACFSCRESIECLLLLLLLLLLLSAAAVVVIVLVGVDSL